MAVRATQIYVGVIADGALIDSDASARVSQQYVGVIADGALIEGDAAARVSQQYVGVITSVEGFKPKGSIF